MTYLHTVTITGADDAVDPAELARLSERFPFVEWGLLWNWKATPPRYPSLDWLVKTKALPRRSLHLCGRAAREAMAGHSDPVNLAHALGVQRVQLNGFSNVSVEGMSMMLSHLRVEGILQCDGLEALLRARHLTITGWNVSALVDASGGRGIELAEALPIVPKELRAGWAGGIKLSNIVAKLERFETLGRPYWIDLETGARDEHDRFDIALVEAELEAAAPFVCPENRKG